MSNICLVGSHGGHLFQMTRLMSDLEMNGYKTFIITYDEASILSLKWKKYFIKNIGINIFLFLKGFLQMAYIFKNEKPDILVTTGAEIAIAAIFLCKIMQIPTIFIESLARIEKPSYSGILVYPLVDYFFIQSPKLKKHYGPKAVYMGTLI
ncbi:MAG: PssD/Cps14F family polysaccharide biosynthesis glycosyltransferase [Candidatus Hodarchaeota archaeon]